jgi:hypothetical protein
MLLGSIAAQRNGNGAQRREVGAVEAAVDDFALILR